MKALSAFFVMTVTAASASAQQTDTLGNIVVTQLPLASGESVCGAFGGDNSDDLYLVTLQGAVSRAYNVDQTGLNLITDSGSLCVQNATAPTAGQVGTVSGKVYVTTLGPSAEPQSIVVGGIAILQPGTNLPGGTVVTSFRSQPAASDGLVVIVNDQSGDGILYRYDGTTWTVVPKPTGEWTTYHVVGTGAQRDVYAEDGLNTISLFSNGTTTTLFDAADPPVAGNPISCCLTMAISPVDGTGIVNWGTGQNSYRVASFTPGQPPTLIAQEGTPPATFSPAFNPTALWPINHAGAYVLFMGTYATSDLSTPNQAGEVSFIWDAQASPFNWGGVDYNGFQSLAGLLSQNGGGQIFLGVGRFVDFLTYGDRINSQLQGLFTASAESAPELALWGYMPRINSVSEDASFNITLETNVISDFSSVLPVTPVSIYAYVYGGIQIPVAIEGNGVFTFQYPSNYTLGEHPIQIQVCMTVCAGSAWVLYDFEPPASPSVSFTVDRAALVSGQSANLTWSTSNAVSVSIDQGIGPVQAAGTVAVSPTTTTTYTLTASNAGGTSTAWVTVTVTPAPVINAGGVVNAATFDARFSPASIISVFGQNLAGGTASALFQQGAFVPAWVDQTGQAIQILAGGRPCPLVYVAPTQINCQLSWGTAVASPVAVQALKGGLGGNTVDITLTATAPAPFMFQGMAIITDEHGQLITESNPAVQGGVYTLWLQGLGTTSSQPADGVPFGSELGVAQAAVSLTFSGNAAKILFAGGAPGEIINQMNFVFPEVPSAGSSGLTELTGQLSVGGQSISLVVPVLYGQ
jgi:uncharacterized protein (TIGR03437 family)